LADNKETKITLMDDGRSNIFLKLHGMNNKAAIFIAISMSLYQLYIAAFGVFNPTMHRAIHLGFGLVLTFLVFPFSKKKKSKYVWIDYILIILSIFTILRLITGYYEILAHFGAPLEKDVILGAILIIIVIEATRRIMGWPLVILAGTFLLYGFTGPYLPGIICHKGYSISRVAEHMYLTTEGIFGVPLYASATYVFIFVLFGAFLQQCGGSKFFIDLAFALTGRARGGPAKAAVLASGAMGMISGSSYANVVTTGTFTIPLMKEVGYKPEFAAGVEAAASTGGQIMPPVMGAAAFIMAEMIGVPYLKIVVSAILPAILYFFAIGIMVDFEAIKSCLKGMPADKLPAIKNVFKKGYLLIIPPATIVYFLLKGFSPNKAGFYAVIATVVVSMFKKETRMGIKEFLNALETGAKNSLSIVAACGTCGIIIGIVTLTGLGLKLSNLILYLSKGMLFPTLILTMIASLILGMGLPTTALYIILAVIVAPALVTMGVPILAAHLFIFYFGVFSAVTPPVALTSYLGAGIAKADGAKSAIQGFKLSMAAFIVPFIFVISPSILLLDNSSILEIMWVLVLCLVGAFCLGASLEGYLLKKLNIILRILLFAGAICFIIQNIKLNILAFIILTIVYVFQKLTK